MTQSDDEILELLANRPGQSIRMSPKNIEANLDWSVTTVRRRLANLLEAGLVRKWNEKSGIYEITEKGHSYLDGTLEKSELQLD